MNGSKIKDSYAKQKYQINGSGNLSVLNIHFIEAFKFVVLVSTQ